MIATTVAGLLLALSMKTEMFLRFLMGENRVAVFVKMLGSLLATLLFAIALALLFVRAAAGAEWVASAFDYLKLTTALTIFAMALPMAVTCSKNLIRLYQEREG